MSSHSIPNVAPPRTSARIEARQNRGVPGWITPAGGNEEKRLITALVDYLHDTSENVAVLRYLTKEYRVLAPTMNTIPTLRKVRKRLMELGVPYLQYNYSRKKWLYWNDYSESGMTAWQEQAELPSSEEDELNQDEDETQQEGKHGDQSKQGKPSESEEGQNDKQDLPDWQGKGDHMQVLQGKTHSPGNRQDEEIHVQQSNKPTSPDPPTDKDPPATKKAPLDPSTNDDEEAYEAPPTHSPPLLTPQMGIQRPGRHPEWFQSPPRIRNPYTGQQLHTPLPTGLQNMVKELQDHDDWFDNEGNDGMTPDTAVQVDGEKKHRHRTPPTDEDGFITVPLHRNTRLDSNLATPRVTQHQRPPPPTKQHNMYQVLMDDAMESLSGHARVLENAALLQHQNRLATAKEEFQSMVKRQSTKSHGQPPNNVWNTSKHWNGTVENKWNR